MRASLRLLRAGFGLGLFLILAVGLRAAFEISATGLERLADDPLVISRQSIEARSEEMVAQSPIRNGQARLRVAAEAGLYFAQIGDLKSAFVVADGQTLRVALAADGKNLQITGARDQELFSAYEAFRAASLARHVTPARERIAALPAGSDAEIVRLTEAEVAGYQVHRRELNDFTFEKLRGSAALYAASLRWDGDHRLNELAAVVNEYAQKNPALEISRLMEERVQRFRATARGALAPSLAGPSPAGTTVSLNDLRGKYVLVDFWASWCSPCRVENRNYAELYRRYHSAGFEILAVSVDENAAAWKAAIAKDNAAWLHVSDLTGWRNAVASAYNVSALPASFLLDPQGRIIAKDLRGKALADRLAALLTSGANR